MAPDVEKRLRYFNGQFLKEEDFTDEQVYHIDRQRRHNRLLHTPGIAEGLDVKADTGARDAKVMPGTAVDAEGRFIVLAHERTVNLEQHSGQTVLLVISYGEEEAELVTVGGGNTRWHERPRVEVVSADEALPPDTYIQLARLSIDEKGAVSSEPDTSVRGRAGVRLGGEVEVRQLTLARDGVNSSQWPALSCGAAGRADLSGDLSVSGNIGVGTKTPDTLLTVGDGTNRDLLKFVNTAKGWKFAARGSGPATTLDLQALESGKSFRVVSRDGTRVPLQVHTSDAEGRNAVHLVQNGGNVGIGTTTPEATLDVRGTPKAEVKRVGLAFEDNGACVDCGNLGSLPDNHTIEFWIKFWGTRADYAQILAKHIPPSEKLWGDRSPGIWCNPNEASLHWRYEPGNKGSNHFGPEGVDSQFSLGQWYHVAGVKKADKLTIYINGGAVGEDIDVPGTMASGPGPFRIGQTTGHDNRNYPSFNGQIAEVRIWNRARTAAKIKTDMNVKLSGQEPGLVGYWPCDDGAGEQVRDLTPNANHGTTHGAQWFQEFPPTMTITGYGNVGIGTPDLKMKLEVNGDIRATYGNIRLGPDASLYVPGAVENLNLIRGTVRPDGSILEGQGFTVDHKKDTGLYNISFDSAFFAKPTVVVTQQYPDGDDFSYSGGSTRDNCVVVAVSRTQCRIKCGDGEGKPSDRRFHFIAIGPR